MATVMDDFHAAELPVSLRCDRPLLSFTFQSGDGCERLLAGWVEKGSAGDAIVQARTDATFPVFKAKQAWAIDIMNGTQQELNLKPTEAGTAVNGLLIKDYPTFVRLR